MLNELSTGVLHADMMFPIAGFTVGASYRGDFTLVTCTSLESLLLQTDISLGSGALYRPCNSKHQ